MTTTTPDGQSSSVWYDTYGNVSFTQDALGYINYAGYDEATGAETISIVDVNPATLPIGVTMPADLSRFVPGSIIPLALTTITAADNLGRPTQVTDPNGNVTTYTYPVDNQSEYKVVVTPPQLFVRDISGHFFPLGHMPGGDKY